MAQTIPHDKSPDSTLALLREGYDFIPKRCRRYGTDVFETRLMFRRAVCMSGVEASRVFYEPGRFTRKGAIPPTTVRLLQDLGSVQLLGGEAHRWRKQMFMSLMGPESVVRLTDLMADRWRAYIWKWQAMGEVVLHDEVEEILCRAVCEWAGVPLREPEVGQRTREMEAMISGSGSVGPQMLRGLLLRTRTERWLQDIVKKLRNGEFETSEGSPASVIVNHRDAEGRLLDPEVAAVEILNLLRPTVAIARFVTFAALALHEHPECRQTLRAGDNEYLDCSCRKFAGSTRSSPSSGDGSGRSSSGEAGALRRGRG